MNVSMFPSILTSPTVIQNRPSAGIVIG
jgi:hypothetical protein